ncbi:MAG: hypothetical protein IH948_10055 [Bacteroidetes bacterium]|nr:hypothetical protein [Bacteroidota bacterium]
MAVALHETNVKKGFDALLKRHRAAMAKCWHHDDVYTVLIEDKEYVLFGTEMEKVVNNDKS